MGAVCKPLTPAKYKKVRKLAAEGCTRTSIAEYLRIGKTKFYELMRTDSTLKEAIEAGEDVDVAVCKSVVRERAMNTKNPAWMDRYLYLRHNIKHQNAVSQSAGGVTINLTLPFQTGSDHHQALQQGITIEHGQAETHE